MTVENYGAKNVYFTEKSGTLREKQAAREKLRIRRSSKKKF